MTIQMVRGRDTGTISLADAKAHLSELVDRVETGDTVDRTVECGFRGPVDRSSIKDHFFHVATVFGSIP